MHHGVHHRAVQTIARTKTIGWHSHLFFLAIASFCVLLSVLIQSDFAGFYGAAKLLRAQAPLYDLGAQEHVGLEHGNLFVSPPIVAALFVPLSFLPSPLAFFLWTIFNLYLLTLTVSFLSRGLEFGTWPLLLVISFLPVGVELGQGQLSIIAFCAFVAAFGRWRKENYFVAGLCLSIALIKYPLVVGFIAVLVLKRMWKPLLGFSVGACAFAAASLALVGWRELLSYPRMVSIEENGAGVNPEKMACFRGLIEFAGGGKHTLALCMSLSIIIVCLAAWFWRDNLEFGFSAAIIASLLCAYHLNPQDLVLLLLPVFILLPHLPEDRRIPFALLCYVLPWPFWGGAMMALFTLPLLAAFGACCWMGRAIRIT